MLQKLGISFVVQKERNKVSDREKREIEREKRERERERERGERERKKGRRERKGKEGDEGRIRKERK